MRRRCVDSCAKYRSFPHILCKSFENGVIIVLPPHDTHSLCIYRRCRGLRSSPDVSPPPPLFSLYLYPNMSSNYDYNILSIRCRASHQVSQCSSSSSSGATREGWIRISRATKGRVRCTAHAETPQQNRSQRQADAQTRASPGGICFLCFVL